MTTNPGARTDGPGEAWTGASLAALDLEGSGAQDHEDEAILEIAVVPLATGTVGGAAGTRTQDRRIMSPLL